MSLLMGTAPQRKPTCHFLLALCGLGHWENWFGGVGVVSVIGGSGCSRMGPPEHPVPQLVASGGDSVSMSFWSSYALEEAQEWLVTGWQQLNQWVSCLRPGK